MATIVEGSYEVTLKIKKLDKTCVTEKFKVEAKSESSAPSQAKRLAREKYKERKSISTVNVKTLREPLKTSDWIVNMWYQWRLPDGRWGDGGTAKTKRAVGPSFESAKLRCVRAAREAHRVKTRDISVLKFEVAQKGAPPPPPEEPVNTNDPDFWDTLLSVFGDSSDFAETAATLMKLKKIASKIGILGIAVDSVAVIKDLAQLPDLVDKYKKATSESVKSQIASDMVKIGASTLKAIATNVIPVCGYVDLACTAISTVYKKVEQASIDQKNIAKKDEYTKESWALPSTDSRYEAEWKMYANGAKKDDILDLRDLAEGVCV